MKIVIDARMYGLENAGIGRYILNLIANLEKIDIENEYYILLRKKYFLDLNFKNPHFHKIDADIQHYSLKEQICLPFILYKIKPDFVHFPHFNLPIFWFGKYVVTIHDLIKHNFKGISSTTRQPWLYWFKFFIYRIIVFGVIKRSQKIITPSFYWQKEIVTQFKLLNSKVEVTYEGVDQKWTDLKFSFNDFQQTLDKYKIKKPFILYVGNLYPHKNVERLIESIKINQINLVIVCARNVFWQRLNKIVKEKGVVEFVNFTGFVTDEELFQLYHESICLAFPSLMEGFGLPGLEAMMAGTPVLASNSSCLPEIYGQAALYFNPYNTRELADKLNLIKNDIKLRERLIILGKRQLKHYNWEKMARETLTVYNQVNSL